MLADPRAKSAGHHAGSTCSYQAYYHARMRLPVDVLGYLAARLTNRCGFGIVAAMHAMFDVFVVIQAMRHS